MNYDDDKYADIGAIVEHWGNTISLFLPTIHALTGCDTTSFFYRVGKVRILKKMCKNPEQCMLLSGLGHDEVLEYY